MEYGPSLEEYGDSDDEGKLRNSIQSPLSGDGKVNKADAKSSSPQILTKLHAAVKQRALPDDKTNYLEIDVPADGTCLFYSVMFSVLLPVLHDKNNFAEKFKLLFGTTNITLDAAESLHTLLQRYDGNPQFIIEHASQLEVLVDTNFRQRVMAFMRSHKEDFGGFVSENLEAYLVRMAKPKSWGDQPEIEAISRLLQRRIKVYREDASILTASADHNAQADETIYLIYTGAAKDKARSNTHYHYAIPTQHLKLTVMPAVNADAKDVLPQLQPMSVTPMAAALIAQSSLFAAAPADKNSLPVDAKATLAANPKTDAKDKNEAAGLDLSIDQTRLNFSGLI